MSATASYPPSRAGLSPRQMPVPMTFPPPPTTGTKSANKKKHVPIALNFKSRSRHSSSSDSSSVNSFNLQKAPKPILRKSIKSTKRTRQWILLLLLVLSFIILILSAILAYCAALPHRDNIAGAQASALASTEGWSGPVTSTISITSATSTPTAAATNAYELSPAALQPPRRRSSINLLTTRTTSSLEDEIDAALAQDAKDHARFSTPGAQAALTFYTTTLPVLTMLHTAIELLVSLIRPETSQNTRLGDKLLFRSPSASRSTSPTDILARRRTSTLLSFTTSTLLVLGWSTMQLLTLNCEIVTFGNNGESACPVQIRGHRMGGIAELSVGKIVLGFAVILGYVAYCVYLVRVVGVFGGRGNGNVGRGGVSGFKRRARFAEGERVGNADGEKDGTFTVIQVDCRTEGGVV